MHAAFANCCRSLKRNHEVQAIRATEVTYSEERGDFHPHMHVAVRGAAVANALIAEWLERWPNARRVAQDARQASEGAVSELFKYATKLASDKRNADGSRGVVPARALDVIFTALRSLRLWQPVGVRAADDDAANDDAEMQTDTGTPAITRITESIVWQWNQRARDWVDYSTGECLTCYAPGPAVSALLDLLETRAIEAEHLRQKRSIYDKPEPPGVPRSPALTPGMDRRLEGRTPGPRAGACLSAAGRGSSS
jgi:hypothetical protein